MLRGRKGVLTGVQVEGDRFEGSLEDAEDWVKALGPRDGRMSKTETWEKTIALRLYGIPNHTKWHMRHTMQVRAHAMQNVYAEAHGSLILPVLEVHCEIDRLESMQRRYIYPQIVEFNNLWRSAQTWAIQEEVSAYWLQQSSWTKFRMQGIPKYNKSAPEKLLENEMESKPSEWWLGVPDPHIVERWFGEGPVAPIDISKAPILPFCLEAKAAEDEMRAAKLGNKRGSEDLEEGSNKTARVGQETQLEVGSEKGTNDRGKESSGGNSSA